MQIDCREKPDIPFAGGIKPKDRLVQNLLAWGMTQTQIAKYMGASWATVHRSLVRIRKTGNNARFPVILQENLACSETLQNAKKPSKAVLGTPLAFSDSSLISSPTPVSESIQKAMFLEEEGTGEKEPLKLAEPPIPYEDIFGYLNEETGHSYEWQGGRGEKNRALVRHLWDRGFRAKDFAAVIDAKCRDWNHAPRKGQLDMRPYLRPATLFGASKFEQYLNQGDR